MHTVECFPGGAAISVLHGVVHLNDIRVHVHIRSKWRYMHHVFNIR